MDCPSTLINPAKLNEYEGPSSTGENRISNQEIFPNLEEIKQQILLTETKVRQLGKPVTGRIIMAFHKLPFTYHLHPANSQVSHTGFPSAADENGHPRSLGQDTWSLHPFNCHTATTAGLRSLTNHQVTLVGWPEDIRDPQGHVLSNNDLTADHKASLVNKLSQLSHDHMEKMDCISSVCREEIDWQTSTWVECVPVWLEDKVTTVQFEGFCKGYLWPIFCHIPFSEYEDTKYERAAWSAYERVNEAFAKKIVEIYCPGDIIWIQDYHLLLLPGILRKLLPKCYIGLSLHAPFPSFKIFRCFPRHEPILSEMLRAELICFQSESCVSRFLSCCANTIGCKVVDNGVEINSALTAIMHFSHVKPNLLEIRANMTLLRVLECMLRERQADRVPPLDVDLMALQFSRSNMQRLILLDYDGTLTPIVKNPADALPPPGLLDTLATLCSDPLNTVYIISGREASFLQEHLGHVENLGMSAEHGCFLRQPGLKEWKHVIQDVDISWLNDVESIFREYEANTPGAMVEKKVYSIAWHYRNASPTRGPLQARRCQIDIESMRDSRNIPIDVSVGKKVLEVRPARAHKGNIVNQIVHEYPNVGFVLCAGDDKTDEDMFRALQILGHVNLNPTQVTNLPSPSLTMFPKHMGNPISHGDHEVFARSSGKFNSQSSLAPRKHFSTVKDGPPHPINTPCKPKRDPGKNISDINSLFSVIIDKTERRRTAASFCVKTPLEFVHILSNLADISSRKIQSRRKPMTDA